LYRDREKARPTEVIRAGLTSFSRAGLLTTGTINRMAAPVTFTPATAVPLGLRDERQTRPANPQKQEFG
jgi:hypothetical protein